MTLRSLQGMLCLMLVAMPAAVPAQTAATLIARAEAGETSAQSELAFIYHRGQSVIQNFRKAAMWATRAAENGDAKAQNLLGRYHQSGLGVEKDQAKAIEWLSAAAETGNPKYLFDLGHALENGADGSSAPEDAARYYARAAEAGHVEAAVSLGLLYQEGRGVEQDYEHARRLYEGPASDGHPRAQNNLGLLYVRGNGVPQDHARAAELVAASAAQGFSKGIRNLGVMYENGFGVPLDEDRAMALYRKAGQGDEGPGLHYDPRLAPPPTKSEALERVRHMAQAGDPVAQFQLGWLLARERDAPFQNLATAARLFRLAAEAGHGPSMINLALMYFQGRGMPQDYVLGRMWLTLAGSAGQPDAARLSAQFGPRMTTDQIEQAQSLAEAHADN